MVAVLLVFHGSGLASLVGRSPLGVPFVRAKGTKTRLGRSPLRTSLGSEALWLWIIPNRPRGKPILCATTSAAAQLPNVESTCLRRIGPATGGDYQTAPKPDAVTKMHHGTTWRASAAAAQGVQTILFTSASVGGAPAPCKETSGGNALGDSLVTFSSGRKSP